MSDFITARHAATVRTLARIIRTGSDTECLQAFDTVMADHGPDLGGEIWDDAMAMADGHAETENGGVL
jgi:hypothetical protein